MPTLKEDILKYSDWIVKAFAEDGLKLDYSIDSLMEIDKFIQMHTINGNPIKGRRLSKNMGGIIFSLSAYIGETLIKNIPDSEWITDDNDPKGEINISVKLGNGITCYPGQRMIKRIQNGLEDGIYPYGYVLTKQILNKEFNQSFWKIEEEVTPLPPKKPWWKF